MLGVKEATFVYTVDIHPLSGCVKNLRTLFLCAKFSAHTVERTLHCCKDDVRIIQFCFTLDAFKKFVVMTFL